MVVSMVAFSVDNVCLQMATQTLTIGHVLMRFGIGDAVFLLALPSLITNFYILKQCYPSPWV